MSKHKGQPETRKWEKMGKREREGGGGGGEWERESTLSIYIYTQYPDLYKRDGDGSKAWWVDAKKQSWFSFTVADIHPYA